MRLLAPLGEIGRVGKITRRLLMTANGVIISVRALQFDLVGFVRGSEGTAVFCKILMRPLMLMEIRYAMQLLPVQPSWRLPEHGENDGLYLLNGN